MEWIWGNLGKCKVFEGNKGNEKMGILMFYVVEHVLREEGDGYRKGYARGARVSRRFLVFICQGGWIHELGRVRLPCSFACSLVVRRWEASPPSELGCSWIVLSGKK